MHLTLKGSLLEQLEEENQGEVTDWLTQVYLKNGH